MVTSPKKWHKSTPDYLKKNALLCLSVIFTMKYIGLLYWRFNQLSTGVFFIEIWLERKKTGQIKRMISRRRLIFFYTIQQVIPKICTKFRNPRCSSSCENLSHTHARTHALLWKRQKIYTPYFVYRGYNYILHFKKTRGWVWKCSQIRTLSIDPLLTRRVIDYDFLILWK